MILILDNYDSFTYNLVHLIAAHTSDYKVVRNDVHTVDEIRQMNPEGILISPGPGRPEDAGITEALIREMGTETPVLGVCLGYQAIGQVFGARVVHAPSLMHGKTSEVYHNENGLFHNVPVPFTATRYHSLVLANDTIPDTLEVTCKTSDGVLMGVKHKSYPIEGIQFHPESILTVEGPKLISNWVDSLKLTSPKN